MITKRCQKENCEEIGTIKIGIHTTEYIGPRIDNVKHGKHHWFTFCKKHKPNVYNLHTIWCKEQN